MTSLDESKVDNAHTSLGLTDEGLVDIYRTMLLARRADDRMWALNRQGRAPFVVSSSGHEAAQVASVAALDAEIDWCLPYYRDVGVVLAWGMTPEELFLGVFSKEADPMSGGRQMPNHWSSRRLRMFSHSSPIGTQFPHAAGIAYALKADKQPGVVAVYAGEGATSEGDWHEAMNFAGIHRLPMICVIENNRYAISVPEQEEVAGSLAARGAGYGMPGVAVDGNDALSVYEAMRNAVERARSGGGPTLIEMQTYRYYAHTSDDDDKLYRTPEEVEQWRKRDPLLLLRQYLIERRILTEAAESQIDEEVSSLLATSVESAEAASAPEDPLSGVYARPIQPFEPVVEPEPEPAGEDVNLITAINRGLAEIMAADPETLTFGEDVADPKGGVFKATAGLTDAFGLERSFNTPLAESLIVGLAIGMTATGKRPIPEIQFADFIHPAFDQIVSEAARLHYRSAGDWPCPIVIRVPYGGGIHGGLYHSQSIESFYAHVPGLKVVVPSTPADAKGLLWEAVEDPDPVMFLEPKRLYRLVSGPYPEGEHRVPLGRAALRSVGTDLTIVAYGAMAFLGSQAVEELAADGISAELIDLRSLKPLDWPTVEASVRKTGKVLIVHEDNEFVGYGAEVAAQVSSKSFEWLDAPVTRYASADVPTFPFSSALEPMVLPSAEGIVEKARELAKY
ncbi:MAG: thiamine pyrophosphate-dependent enzyme [Acidimicrobiia bacterium]